MSVVGRAMRVRRRAGTGREIAIMEGLLATPTSGDPDRVPVMAAVVIDCSVICDGRRKVVLHGAVEPGDEDTAARWKDGIQRNPAGLHGA